MESWWYTPTAYSGCQATWGGRVGQRGRGGVQLRAHATTPEQQRSAHPSCGMVDDLLCRDNTPLSALHPALPNPTLCGKEQDLHNWV
jgi:hypothetical protein